MATIMTINHPNTDPGATRPVAKSRTTRIAFVVARYEIASANFTFSKGQICFLSPSDRLVRISSLNANCTVN